MHLMNLQNIPPISGEEELLPSTSSSSNQGQPRCQLYSVEKSSTVPLSHSYHVHKQISCHNMQNIIASPREQSATFPSVPPPGRTQTEFSALNSVGQSLNISNMCQSSDCYPESQCSDLRTISNSPGQMQGRHDIQQIFSQQQPQNVQQDVYQKQLERFYLLQNKPEASSTLNSLGSSGQTSAVHRHEIIYQKIRSMKALYMPHLIGIHKQFINLQLQNGSNSIEMDNYKKFRPWLESILRMFQRFPNNISPSLTEAKLLTLERNIIEFINVNRNKRNLSSLQKDNQQRQPLGVHSRRTQTTQLRYPYNQMNIMMRDKNVNTAVTAMQPNAGVSLQHDYRPSLSSRLGLRAVQPNSVDTFQTSYPQRMDSIHKEWRSSRNNINELEHKSKFSQLNSNTLDHMHLNQQYYQSGLSHQLIQKQKEKEIIEQQHQQHLLQLNPQLQTIGRESAYNQHSLKFGGVFHISSPQPFQATSPHLSLHSSPRTDQQSSVSSSQSKSGTPLQPTSSPFPPSPTSLVPSPMLSGLEKQSSCISSHSNAKNDRQKQTVNSGPQSPSLVIGSPGVSASPSLTEFTNCMDDKEPTSTVISGKTSDTEKPIERLIKVVKSMPHKALTASVCDIYSAVSVANRIATSEPLNHSKASIDEDLAVEAKHQLANKNLRENEVITRNNITSHSSGVPLTGLFSDVSENDGFSLCNGMETSDMESTATSRIKRRRIEANQQLLREVKEINQQLIDTIVNISKEDNNSTSTIVNCSFAASTLDQHQTFPVLPISFLVPSDYPNSSPKLLDKSPHISKDDEDLLVKARSEFGRYLHCVSHPLSLKELARIWDTCARAVILEYSVKNGGRGSFSTRYGNWETVYS